MEMLLNDNTTYQVSEEDIEKWRELYPAVTIENELRGMVGWLDANPKKRKTRKGIKRFINSWLMRAQDAGGRSPYSTPKQTIGNRPNAKLKSGPTPTKQMSAEDELCDISWVKADRKPAIRALFLEKYGHVFEG